jgi:hypothetical protein
MKKITKPAEKEEFVYYSDFSGKHMGDICSPVEVKIDFNYGSKRDGANLIQKQSLQKYQTRLEKAARCSRKKFR